MLRFLKLHQSPHHYLTKLSGICFGPTCEIFTLKMGTLQVIMFVSIASVPGGNFKKFLLSNHKLGVLENHVFGFGTSETQGALIHSAHPKCTKAELAPCLGTQRIFGMAMATKCSLQLRGFGNHMQVRGQSCVVPRYGSSWIHPYSC